MAFTHAAFHGPPGLSPTTTCAPRSIRSRHSSVTSTGCVTAPVPGFIFATRFALTAIFMPGVTQSSPPTGPTAARIALRAVAGS